MSSGFQHPRRILLGSHREAECPPFEPIARQSRGERYTVPHLPHYKKEPPAHKQPGTTPCVSHGPEERRKRGRSENSRSSGPRETVMTKKLGWAALSRQGSAKCHMLFTKEKLLLLCSSALSPLEAPASLLDGLVITRELSCFGEQRKRTRREGDTNLWLTST